jgi:hypothetical protein
MEVKMTGTYGMTGAPLFGIVTTPENFVKTQMQMDNIQAKRFRGSYHCASTLVKEHGFMVLFTGHGVNTLREGAHDEGFREILLQQMGNHPEAAVPLSRSIAFEQECRAES